MQAANRIFDSTLALWPDQFDIIAEESVLGSVKTSPNLLEIYEKIEKASNSADSLLAACIWSLHQALWEYAEKIYEKGQLRFSKFDIPFSVFNENMLNNMSGDDWTSELQFYKNS